MTDLLRLAWPPTRVVEALECLAKARGLPSAALVDAAPTWGAGELDADAFDRWVGAGAAWLGLEAEPIDVEHGEVETLLLRATPALLRSPIDGRLFVVAKASRAAVTLLGPDREVQRVAASALRELLCNAAEAPVARTVERWLGGVVDDPARLRRAREAIARELLAHRIVLRCWLLRLPPSASFFAQLRAVGVVRRAAALLVAHAVQYGLSLYAWYALGAGALGGEFERDWLMLWVLLVISSIPVQILTGWLQGRMLREASITLKRRLLAGTLRVELDLLRRAGVGQMWGRAMDASALEALAMSGGLFAVLAIVEFVILCGVMTAGPGGAPQTVVFGLWAALTLAMCWHGFRAARRWTDARRDMTSDVVEQMVGHRTRLAQLPPERWHDGDDELLERYHGLSRTMDQRGALVGAMHQGWYVVALATLAPVLAKTGTSPAALAVAIGGMLLGASALSRLTAGFGQIASAVTAWEQVKPLFVASGKTDALPAPEVVAAQLAHRPPEPDDAETENSVLDASDLTFAYPGRPQPVLRGGTIKLRAGDRALLEGPSGGGKSTFAALLAGARKPQSGLLLLEGLDWQTVGAEEWRRRVAAAPQYHENHILSETLLFNLLMGRTWPPRPADIREAEAVCAELGLGELLRRMPAGIMQMLGETGWRLSHGERSRVFIARVLLQGGKVVILDETFAALDPKTVEQCLRCVLQRAPTLVVIAHP